MSMVKTVNDAINAGKAALGDLVVGSILRTKGTRVYNPATGLYTFTDVDTPIEVALDKFDYTEMLAPGFDINQIKVNVFNPTNTLNITTSDQIVMNGVTYAINKIQRMYVGTTVPVFVLYLRK